MKNFKILFLHEISQQVKSFKFLLTIILAIIITFACTYVQVKDFNDRYDTYIEARNTASDLKNTFLVYSQFKIPVLIPPNPLSIFSKGYDEQAGNKIVFSILDLPELQTTEQKSNPFLSIFSNFDIVSIVGIILSIMAVFIVADAISGEREEEMLKLVFSHRVSRPVYFLAKYLGSLVILTIPLVLIFLITLLYMQFQPNINMDPADWGRVLEIFISCLLFLSVFVLIGLMISSFFSTGAVSILVGLIIWLLMVIIYPNTVDYIVAQAVNIPTNEELKTSLQIVREERFTVYHENREKCGFPPEFCGSSCIASTGMEGIYEILFITTRDCYMAAERQVQLNLPVLFEYQGKELDVKDDYNNRLYRQKVIAGYFKFPFPNTLLENASSKASNTDYRTRVVKIHADARLFRSIVLDYLREKGAIGMKFFTQMPEEAFKDRLEDYDEEAKKEWCEDHPLLNVDDAPVFTMIQRFNVPYEMGILTIMNLLFFIAGTRIFTFSSLIKR
jgi:ABC-type transport system involved in multi-copper enzyme maturation permease subunit